jgi:hypothetical protein
MARVSAKAAHADIETGLYVSQPNAKTGTGGGIEYVQFQGPGVSRAILNGGLAPMLATYGINVPASAIYMSADGYGTGRSHVVRVKRADAEGLKAPEKAAKPAKVLAPWSPPSKR